MMNSKRVMWERMLEHVGHRIECVTYGDGEDVWNAALECETCKCVIVDVDNEEMDDD